MCTYTGVLTQEGRGSQAAPTQWPSGSSPALDHTVKGPLEQAAQEERDCGSQGQQPGKTASQGSGLMMSFSFGLADCKDPEMKMTTLCLSSGNWPAGELHPGHRANILKKKET